MQDRAAQLLPGTGSFEVTAAVAKSFQGGLDAFVRAEVALHPTDWLTAGAFAQADLQGLQAGIFAKGTF